MALKNKLGITDSAALAKEEERISKQRAIELFESGRLDMLQPGTYATLAERLRPEAGDEPLWQREQLLSWKTKLSLRLGDVSGFRAGAYRKNAAAHL